MAGQKENRNEPLVSIGIPTYQRPIELRNTLKEILAQTYRNIEVVVSDNGSQGKEVNEVIEEFLKQDDRIRYFRQSDNLGPVQNFQFVLEQSLGEYFMWCADDDWHAPRFVESLVEAMTHQPNAALAFSNFKAIDTQGNEWGSTRAFCDQLQLFTTQSKWLRLWRFFIQPEWNGKANMIYGMMRRGALLNFSLSEFVSLHNVPYADNLFVFNVLKSGPLALVTDTLYGARVGNTKHHTNTSDGIRLSTKKVLSWKHYLFGYLTMVNGSAKVLYFLGTIWKTLQFLNHALKTRIIRE